MRKVFTEGREGRLVVDAVVYYDPPVPNPKGKAGSITTHRAQRASAPGAEGEDGWSPAHRVWGPGVDCGPAPGQLRGTVKRWMDDKGFGFALASAPVARPSAQQLAWQDLEVSAMLATKPNPRKSFHDFTVPSMASPPPPPLSASKGCNDDN
eukprot:gene25498-48025_t